MKYVASFLASLALAVTTAASANDCNQTPTVGGGSSSVGTGNPASVFCAELGGEFVMMRGRLGEWAYCQIGRAQIEEWSLFRSLKGNEGYEQAVAAFLAGQTCEQAGGSVTGIYSPTLMATIDTCTLPDGSDIARATLAAGPDTAGTRAMAAAIRNYEECQNDGEPEGHTAREQTVPQADSRILFDILRRTVPRANAGSVGADLYKADTAVCSLTVVPGMPTNCTLTYAGAEYTLSGSDARAFFSALSRTLGLDNPQLVGASSVTAKDLSCGQPVVPNAVASCRVTSGL